MQGSMGNTEHSSFGCFCLRQRRLSRWGAPFNYMDAAAIGTRSVTQIHRGGRHVRYAAGGWSPEGA